MIELLSRLFSRQETPEDHLMHAAVDAVIDGTDARLRLVPGAGKQLRQPLRTAIDYVRRIVDHLGPVVELCAASFGSDPRVHALFGSVDSMRQVIGGDPARRSFEHDAGQTAGEEAFALLLAERQLKHVLGMQLHGELVLRDLTQTLLLFANHRLRAAAASEAESIRAMRVLAFGQLIGAAHRRLEKVKAGQPLGEADMTPAADERDQRVVDIVGRLGRTATATLTLDDYLALVADVLAHPERHLPAEPFTAVVNRMGTLIEEGRDLPADADRVTFWEIRRPPREMPTAALMVRFRRADFPLPQVRPELL
jgi:hypothetical protein